MIYELLVIGVILVIAMFYDIKSNRIPNVLIIFSMLCSATYFFISDKKYEPFDNLIGMIFPVVVLFILFRIRALGAGDIKLLAFIGSMVGFSRIVNIIIYSMFSILFFGLILIFIQHSLIDRLVCLYKYILSFFHTGNLYSYKSFITYKHKQIPFSICIASGYVIDVIRFYYL